MRQMSRKMLVVRGSWEKKERELEAVLGSDGCKFWHCQGGEVRAWISGKWGLDDELGSDVDVSELTDE